MSKVVYITMAKAKGWFVGVGVGGGDYKHVDESGYCTIEETSFTMVSDFYLQ